MPDSHRIEDSGPIDDDAIRRFEKAWWDGKPLAIEDVVPPRTSAAYLPTLEELVLVEMELVQKRIRPGNFIAPKTVDDYLKRFPELARPEIAERLKNQEHQRPKLDSHLTPLREYRPRPEDVFDTRTISQSAGFSASVPLQSGPPGYEILGVLGRGAMGEVYRARQTTLNRIVALKVMLRGTLAADEDRLRFQTEAASVAALRHPQVVQLYEYGTWQGQPYMALECMDGGTLAAKLASGPMPPGDAAELLELMARAVSSAHERGIIHRDLKPSNVLLDAHGQPKISDFGLAKQSEMKNGSSLPTLTHTGAILGTPAYMAPEQSRGEKVIGPAADIYALGAIFYHQLTGKPPFLGATAVETLQQVQFTEPVPPRRLVPGLPRDLDTICLKCLQKEGPRRYESAKALADDLRAFLEQRPITARPISNLERAIKLVKRQPVIASLALLLVLSVFAGFAGVVWQWRAAVRNFALAEQRAEDERKASAAREEALREMQSSLYLHRISRAERAWRDNQVATTDQLLAECPAELRRWEWQLLKDRCHGERLNIPIQSPCVDYHPNADAIAIASASEVQIRDARTGKVLQTLSTGTTATRLAFHPSGKRLAVAGKNNDVSIWDLEGGREIQILKNHSGHVTCLRFNPAGDRLACGTGVGRPGGDDKHSGEIWVWDLKRFEPIIKRRIHDYPLSDLAYSRDGKRLATIAWDHNVVVLDANDGEEILRIKESLFAVDFSDDGSYLAGGSVENSVRIWDLKSLKIVADLPGHSQRIGCLRFSPDGTRLASASDDGTARIWDWRCRSVAMVIRGHTAPVTGLAWSADSNRIATTAEDVRVWSANKPQEGRLLTRIAEAFAMSHEDHRAATATHGSHAIFLWNLATGESDRALSGHSATVTGLSFVPNSSILASGSLDRSVKLWDTREGKLHKTLAHDRPVTALAINAAGGELAAGCDDGSLVFWSLASGDKLRACKPLACPVKAMCYHPEGKLLAIAGADGTVCLVDFVAQSVVRRFCGRGLPATGVAFMANGASLIATKAQWDRDGAGGGIQVWEIATGKEITPFHVRNSPRFGVAGSPDGTRIAIAGTSIRIWETAKGVQVIELELPDRVSERYFYVKCAFAQVQFSAAGTWLGARAQDGSVWIWGAPQSPAETGRVEAVDWEPLFAKLPPNAHEVQLNREDLKKWGISLNDNSASMYLQSIAASAAAEKTSIENTGTLPIGQTGWLRIAHSNQHPTSY